MYILHGLSPFFFFFFFFLATLHSMWDLSSPTRYQTWAPALEVWSLNHWTTREVPHRLLHITYLKSAFSLSFFPFSLIYLFIYFFFFAHWNLVVSQYCLFDKSRLVTDILHFLNTQKDIISPGLGEMCFSVLFLRAYFYCFSVAVWTIWNFFRV